MFHLRLVKAETKKNKSPKFPYGDFLPFLSVWGLRFGVYVSEFFSENELVFSTLRILGPSNAGVGTCIAGVRVLKIGTFEGSGYLG